MADHEIDEFATDDTPGYKVGEKKTLDEYNKLDENDESLKRWKESLGLGAGAANNTGKLACYYKELIGPILTIIYLFNGTLQPM
jgi:hypothetical protein